MAKLRYKMVKNKSKAKLSPADEMKMNQKVEKLKAGIAKTRRNWRNFNENYSSAILLVTFD